MTTTWRNVLVIGAVVLLLAGGAVGFLGATEIAVPLGDPKQGLVPYEAGRGAALCAHLADRLQLTSSRWSAGSWILGFLSALLVAAGGIVGPGGAEARWYRKGMGVLIATIGGSLAASSGFAVTRSIDASTTAALATSAFVTAIGEPARDAEAWTRCLEAKAGWLQARAKSLAQLPPPSTTRPKGASAEGIGEGSPGPGRDGGAGDARPR